MYIVDERDILIGVSEGLPYDMSGTTGRQLPAVEATSGIIKSCSEYIISIYGSHINAPINKSLEMDYYGELHTLRFLHIKQYNLLWWVVYGMPNELIYGSVNEVNQIISNDMKTLELSTIKDIESNNNESKIRKNNGISLIIICCCAMMVLCLITTILSNRLLITPLTRVIVSLKSITSSDEFSHSTLMEIAMINASIDKIKHNITQLRSYLPTNLFHHVDNMNNSQSSSTLSESLSHNSIKTCQIPEVKTNRNGVIHYRLNIELLRKIPPTRRIITSVVIDIKGFDSWLDRYNSRELVEEHRKYLDIICKITTQYNGTTDVFYGDKLLITWNTMNKNMDHHSFDAATCSMSIKREFNSTRIGVATGPAIFGTMGCDGMRAFSVVGPSVTTAFDLIQFARKRSIIGVLTNQANWENCRSEIKAKWIGTMNGSLYNMEDASKFEVRSPHSVYQLLTQ
eukprot:NODE_1007_length_2185_cov_27.232299_g860_i0.p1 GENE.NODE_1007_length_2185_cov_27.232299_g860_i0~~NODE_1007_length_2185_cov_27.232299_g860_i0.p1  ORF type:complete len:514 (-),score=61.19 NODE_1007_length_2185_cov_27.232299_g860_i0:644-2011(-)